MINRGHARFLSYPIYFAYRYFQKIVISISVNFLMHYIVYCRAVVVVGSFVVPKPWLAILTRTPNPYYWPSPLNWVLVLVELVLVLEVLVILVSLVLVVVASLVVMVLVSLPVVVLVPVPMCNSSNNSTYTTTTTSSTCTNSNYYYTSISSTLYYLQLELVLLVPVPICNSSTCTNSY